MEGLVNLHAAPRARGDPSFGYQSSRGLGGTVARDCPRGRGGGGWILNCLVPSQDAARPRVFILAVDFLTADVGAYMRLHRTAQLHNARPSSAMPLPRISGKDYRLAGVPPFTACRQC